MLAFAQDPSRRGSAPGLVLVDFSPDVPGERRPRSAPSPSLPDRKVLAGVRALVVEDETIVAMDLMQMLEGLGAEVCGTAASGADALRKARALRPEIAIVDIRLKDGETGIDVAGTMAEELGVAIVFATAHTDASLTARMSAVPGAMHLAKPYTARELAEASSRALRRS